MFSYQLYSSGFNFHGWVYFDLRAEREIFGLALVLCDAAGNDRLKQRSKGINVISKFRSKPITPLILLYCMLEVVCCE